MASAYVNAEDRAVLIEDEPLSGRGFVLILLNPQLIKFDVDHESAEDIFGDEEAAAEAEHVALRTQVIADPKAPVDYGNRILQFFAVNPNQESLVERGKGGVLAEWIGGDEEAEPPVGAEELPLFYLSADEVWNLAHGAGFSIAMVPEAVFPPKP